MTVGHAYPVQKLAMRTYRAQLARRRLVALQREADLAASRHRLAGAADRVGPVEVRRWIGKRGRIDRSRLAEGFPGCASHPVGLGEDRIGLPHAATQLAERVESKGMTYGS